jgi:four helix bundle protein
LGAESNKDFIHKNRIIIKELRETFIALRIIDRLGLSNQQNLIENALKENNELISIFVKTVKTSLSKQDLRSNIRYRK